jgi:hypothetical protein
MHCDARHYPASKATTTTTTMADFGVGGLLFDGPRIKGDDLIPQKRQQSWEMTLIRPTSPRRQSSKCSK